MRRGVRNAEEVSMLRALVLIVLGVSASLAVRGHPGSGIVVDEKGRVYLWIRSRGFGGSTRGGGCR